MDDIIFYPVKISQNSRYSFEIEWSDHKKQVVNLSFLQKNCECKICELKETKLVDPLVMATKISTYGRYALKVEFTAGCKSGIFSFSKLRSLAVDLYE